MKLVVLCAMVAIAAAIPSDFNNDVIFKGRRAAAATPCLCKSNTCTVVAPKNGVLGGCASTSYDGKAPTAGTATTCTPKCNTGYNLVGTSSCKTASSPRLHALENHAQTSLGSKLRQTGTSEPAQVVCHLVTSATLRARPGPTRSIRILDTTCVPMGKGPKSETLENVLRTALF